MKEELRIFYLLGRSVLSRALARKLDCQQVVEEFLSIGQSWTSQRPQTAEKYFRQFLRFHRRVKVREADPDGQDDLVELAFGENYPVDSVQPLDARPLCDDDYSFVDDPELCFMFERRVCPSLREGCDPDEDNVAMRVYVSFGKISGLRDAGELGDGVSEGYAELEDCFLNVDDIRQFSAEPSAKRFLQRRAQKISVIVEPAG